MTGPLTSKNASFGPSDEGAEPEVTSDGKPFTPMSHPAWQAGLDQAADARALGIDELGQMILDLEARLADAPYEGSFDDASRLTAARAAIERLQEADRG